MPQQAQITSLDALATFRSQLLVYLAKTRTATADVLDDVARTRVWLQDGQRAFWEAQVRRCQKELEMAQQELFSSRVSRLEAASSAKVMAVTRAQRALAAAEEKLAAVKRWSRRYDNEVAPLAKPVDNLRSFLTTELREAVFVLEQTLRTLDDYAGRGGFGSPSQTTGAESDLQKNSKPVAPCEDGESGEKSA